MHNPTSANKTVKSSIITSKYNNRAEIIITESRVPGREMLTLSPHTHPPPPPPPTHTHPTGVSSLVCCPKLHSWPTCLYPIKVQTRLPWDQRPKKLSIASWQEGGWGWRGVYGGTFKWIQLRIRSGQFKYLYKHYNNPAIMLEKTNN